MIYYIYAVVYGDSLLYDFKYDSTTLTKKDYITLNMEGTSITSTIKPGDCISLEPTLTNEGYVDAYVFIKLTINATMEVYIKNTFRDIGSNGADKTCLDLILSNILEYQCCFKSEDSINCLELI